MESKSGYMWRQTNLSKYSDHIRISQDEKLPLAKHLTHADATNQYNISEMQHLNPRFIGHEKVPIGDYKVQLHNRKSELFRKRFTLYHLFSRELSQLIHSADSRKCVLFRWTRVSPVTIQDEKEGGGRTLQTSLHEVQKCQQ